MKFLLTLIASGLALSSFKTQPRNDKDCRMAVTYAEMAFVNFKKAYKADTITVAQGFLKTGIEQATESSAYAANTDCGCTLAETYALNAVTFGKKASDSPDLPKLKKFAKKAMDASLSVMSAVSSCKLLK